jgi:hypothetical protein
MIKTMSKSKLKLFLTCGHAYKKKYIDKANASNSTDISNLIRGIVVHEITEMIDKGIIVDNEMIENTFLKVFSQFIGRDITITNIDELSNLGLYNDDPKTSKWQKYNLSIENYNLCEFDYKDKMDEVKSKIVLYAELYNDIHGMFNFKDNCIESRENSTIKITDDLTIETTQIFDRIFFMEADKLSEIEREEFTIETFKKDLLKLKKDELMEMSEIEGTKDKLSDDISKRKFPEKLAEYKNEIENEKQQQLSFLDNLGYKKNDMVPVILEIKSTTISKTATSIKQMIDPYLYSMFFKYNYKQMPVFMVLYLIVTPSGKKKYQLFTNYISEKQLENVKDNFISDCKRIFLHNEYKKNFSDQNFLCDIKKCKYFKDCQGDMSLIVATKK